MLPRSSDNTSIIVIVESLENLDITKEFTISWDGVCDALHWLIQNNPLYKDITIDANVTLREEDSKRLWETIKKDKEMGSHSKSRRNLGADDFNLIGQFSSIIRASWNQSNQVNKFKKTN